MKKVKNANRLPIYVVAQPKGGVGKTTVSQQLLPALLKQNAENAEKKIVIYEFDDNNANRYIYSESSNIISKTLKVGKADNILEDLSLDILQTNDTIFILDCGGSNDTHAVLEALKSNDFMGCTYCIPTLAGDDPDSLIALSQKISSFDSDAEFIYFLNKCRDLNSSVIEEDFWQIFGDKDMDGLENNIEKLNISKMFYIPELNIFSKLALFKQPIYETTLKLEELEKIDIRELKLTWSKDGEDGKKANSVYKFAKKCRTGFESFLKYNNLSKGL